MPSLFLLFIDIINSEQSAGEGGGFTEGNEEGFVDLSGRVNEDTAEEENEASDGEHKGCYEL